MLNDWSDFFTMTATAGGTLVGLLFVVVTLGTGLTTPRKLDIALAGFGGIASSIVLPIAAMYLAGQS